MNFTEIIKAKKGEPKEKHIPHIEIDRGCKSGSDILLVVVGHEISHPNTVEHHIVWLELYGLKKENNQVINLGRAACAMIDSNPNVRFHTSFRLTELRILSRSTSWVTVIYPNVA